MERINFSNLPSTTTPVNATNMNQLQTNVDNAKVEKCTNIANTDLNTIVNTSVYYCSSCTNRPVAKNGYLRTTNTGTAYCLQEYFVYNSDESYTRRLVNNTWQDWIDISAPNTITNANGTAVKFSDGTMICYLDTTTNEQAINNAYGKLYIGYYSWIFPEEFYSLPVVNCGTFIWGSGGGWGSSYSITKTGCRLRGYDVSSRDAGTDTIIKAMAIGRWKA